jgi:hypothetical protein
MQIELLNRKKWRTRVDPANTMFECIEIFIQPAEATLETRIRFPDRTRTTLQPNIHPRLISTPARVTKP